MAVQQQNCNRSQRVGLRPLLAGRVVEGERGRHACAVEGVQDSAAVVGELGLLKLLGAVCAQGPSCVRVSVPSGKSVRTSRPSASYCKTAVTPCSTSSASDSNAGVLEK
jgi:hypothetical protein